MAIRLKTVWTLRITPRHQSTMRDFSSTDMLPRHHQQYIRILVQQDRDTSSVNATSSIRICEQCREQ
ncbi:hypothetical protein CUMW_115430 [Citrus unshiu]|nr:hypothetical protein CUMW_115430 [Citrus unshiu]